MSQGEPGGRPLYAISVAAELSGVPVPTLRLFEQHGLVRPARTSGGTRRYSEDDVRVVREINDLVRSGIPLTAVERIIALTERNDDLTTRIAELTEANADLRRSGRDQASPGE